MREERKRGERKEERGIKKKRYERKKRTRKNNKKYYIFIILSKQPYFLNYFTKLSCTKYSPPRPYNNRSQDISWKSKYTNKSLLPPGSWKLPFNWESLEYLNKTGYSISKKEKKTGYDFFTRNLVTALNPHVSFNSLKTRRYRALHGETIFSNYYLI